MSQYTAKCGIDCGLCPAFKENVKGEDYQEMVRRGFLKYHELVVDEVYCDGCLAHDLDNSKQLNRECGIRQCVNEKSLQNCGHCNSYPCFDLVDMFEIIDGIGGRVPQDNTADYDRFVKPYLNRQRLETIRQANKK